MSADIGIDVKEPKQTCEDKNCPFHGHLSVRGAILEGEVASVIDNKTVVIQREYTQKIPKYERYEKRRSKLRAHKPQCIEVNVGDTVKIAECRPLSKTKSYVVVEGG
ncbi:30S ribosomal protein S17 [archaeon SCG-AAA382B04]|nr:30S ribosomal protein S17 [archaeon SCG-AAA382B04]